MTILTVENLAKTYGIHPIFTNVSFTLQTGERAALFGPNGSGKSTILRLILGELRPDHGSLKVAPGLRLGYLPQVPSFPAGTTLASLLGSAETPGGRAPGEALRRFGFTPDAGRTLLADLSSGERTRAALARLWLQEPDLLLLDEPTNHLDLPGLDLLAEFIREHRGAALLVSHDRWLLDQAAQRLIELSPDGARSFPATGAGAYTSYRRQKELEFQSQAALHEKQLKEERRLEKRLAEQKEWADRAHRAADGEVEIRAAKPFYRAKAKKGARRAKATAARLERLRAEKVGRPRRDPRLDLALEDPAGNGRRLILAEGLYKIYRRELLGGFSLGVLRGERIGIIGPNGCGKTTLLRLLLGLEEPDEGRVWRSPSLLPCYLDQELAGLAGLAEGSTVMACASEAAGRSREEVRLLLGCLLFRGADVDKRVRDLSRGERVRLGIARMILSPANLLVLDEPTNHLDVPAREAVEEALAGYAGTLLLVSHDRYLLDRVCGKIVAFAGRGEAVVFPGTYREYEESRAAAVSADGLDPESLPDEERMLLENRLSILSAMLGGVFPDEEARAAVEREFQEVAMRLGKGTGH